MLTSQSLKGNWGTLLLPLNDDSSINYQSLCEEIDWLISAKLNGIYSNGTAGELHNQTENEFDKVQELLAEKCQRAAMPFQVGASNPNPLVCLERVRRCTALKPDAFQVILPDWVAASGDEQIVFLEKLAEAAGDIPLVLYNPPHAKTVLVPQDFLRLSGHVPQLIGIKVAMGDKQWVNDMKIYAKTLAVFVPGHFLASGLKNGLAAGAYSNVACLSPEGAQWWWNLMQSDLPAALEVEQRILQFFDECIVPFKNAGYSNPALDKFLAAVGGWSSITPRLRWPYKWIDVKEVAAVQARAKKLLPEFFN